MHVNKIKLNEMKQFKKLYASYDKYLVLIRSMIDLAQAARIIFKLSEFNSYLEVFK